MKKSFRKVISIVLVLVMLLGTFSVSFHAFAEETQTVSVPSIQTMLTDGKALKKWLETDFLNLEKADALLSDNLPAIAEALCAQLGDLFYQMGYSEEQYPKDQESLMLALARILGSLNTDVFREPEKVETTDMELVYNLAYLGGTQYIETINAALPANLRFDTTEPVLALNAEQQAQVREYYAQWKAGALKLDDFDIKAYLGDMSAQQYLKTVLIIFIADDNRLPEITKQAVDFTIDASTKAVLCSAVANILDNLETSPFSALLSVLSDSNLHTVLKAIIETADKVTVRTDYYSYKIFNEGIFKDTDGSLVEFVSENEDGSYSYTGPSMVSAYKEAVDALFVFLDGIDEDLNDSVLETIFSKRLDKFSVLADKAFAAAVATFSAEQNKLTSDINSANIEIRFAEQKIAEIDSGAAKQSQLAELQRQLDTIAAQIASLQASLYELEEAEMLVKDAVKGYYDQLAVFEEQMTDENMEQITSDPAYVAAKQVVEQTEASLADNYASQKALAAQIAQKSEQADALAQQIADVENGYSPADAKAVYQRMITEAREVIRTSEAALAELPDNEMIQTIVPTLQSLLQGFFTAFDGVYDSMVNESPIKALVKLVYGMQDLINVIENIDWNQIAPVMDPLFDQFDQYLNGVAGRYIGANGGANMLADLSDLLNTFLDTYGIYNYIDKDYLNTFISEQLLGDNSDVMNMASSALSAIFPNVQPTYESIVSCLIPILSAFDFGAIMANMDNISASLSLASPTAFAYLAGISDSCLQSNYLDTINANLVSFGYKGSPVTPMLSLSSTQRASLLSYARMEQNGTPLADIAASGFNWENYVGSTSKLALANAFVKIALGDAAKLGEVAAAPGLGSALVNLLCDLFDDIKSKPVDTLLKKVSDSESLAAIVDFAMGLLNGDDINFKSYDLFFTDNIYYDADGNTAFYVKIVDENPAYKGPKAMGYYVPVIAAALDFLSGLDKDVEKNNGDLLKTLLYDKIPQLKQLIQSAISYEEDGEQKAGAIFYLLLGYGDYLKAENAVMCYDLLISLANSAIRDAQESLAGVGEKIAIWQSYYDQVTALSDAAKLAKAKEFGLIDDAVAVYDADAVNAAIEAKKAALSGEIATLESSLEGMQAQVEAAETTAQQAQEKYDNLTGFEDLVYDDPFYSDLSAIFNEEDLSLIDTLRDDCEADFNAIIGEGMFDVLADLIEEHFDEYLGDADTFMDDYIFADGICYYDILEQVDAENTAAAEALEEAQQALSGVQTSIEQKTQELTAYDNGSVLAQIEAAGSGQTIYISDPAINADDDFDAVRITESINTIRNEEAAGYEQQIAAQNELIEGYLSEQQEVKDNMPTFNPTLVPLAATASDVIAQGLIDVIMGDKADGSENIYHYIMNHDIVNILVTGGRIASVVKMIVGIYEPALTALVSEGILDAETAAQLIAATPSFEAFYNTSVPHFTQDFLDNPVGALGALIHDFTDTIKAGFLTLDGPLAHDVLQLKKVTQDISDIFDARFGEDWANSYAKCLVNRIGEIYQLVVDLLGISYIKDLIDETVGTVGTLSGKLDTSKLYSDAYVSLYDGETLIASVVVEADSDGTFTFKDIPEGRYTLKLETENSVPYEIKAIDVIADNETDLSDSKDQDKALLVMPVGDVDGDSTVGLSDVGCLLEEENYGSSNASCDINKDGIVDLGDISIILAADNYGAKAQEIIF